MLRISDAHHCIIVPKNIRPFQRPPDAERIIRAVFSSSDCQKCGLCCTGRELYIPLRPGEEADRIKKLLGVKGKGYLLDIEHGPRIRTEGYICPMLEGESDGLSCSAYSVRPDCCKIYPLTTVSDSRKPMYVDASIAAAYKNTTGEPLRGIWGLDGICPAIERLSALGIKYVVIEKDLLGASNTFARVILSSLEEAFRIGSGSLKILTLSDGTTLKSILPIVGIQHFGAQLVSWLSAVFDRRKP